MPIDSIIAQYTPPERELPDDEQGSIAMICCDLMTLPERMNKFGKQETPLRWIFLIGGKPMKDGRPFAVSMFASLPMTPKGWFRDFIGKWRGKPISDLELAKGIDLNQYLGKKGLGTISNMPNSKGELWPNITSLMPLPKEMEAGCPSLQGYVRMKDRPKDPRVVEAQKLLNASETDQVPF